MHASRLKKISWLLTGLSLCLVLALPNKALSLTIAYSYDATGRVTSALYSDSQRAAFLYDDAGNMIAQTVVGAVCPTSSTLLLLSDSPENHFSKSLLNQ